MRKFLIVVMLLGTALNMATPRLAAAGCKADCRDTYESDVHHCNVMNDGPDDADDLTRCIDSAKSDYDSCKAACDS
jgi:hypothetical protein